VKLSPAAIAQPLIDRVNYFTAGHFYLTNLLLDKLKASAPSRIVIVTGKIYEWYPLDFDDLQIEHGWNNVKGYSRSKTANILFSTHLAKLLQGNLTRLNILFHLILELKPLA
jgi:retinol dehydrogenase 12